MSETILYELLDHINVCKLQIILRTNQKQRKKIVSIAMYFGLFETTLQENSVPTIFLLFYL